MEKTAASGSLGVDTDLFPVLAQAFEGDYPVDLGEDGIVSSEAHVVPRVYSCALLADKDIPCGNLLAGIPLYTVSLAGAVSAVTRTATRFFVCHIIYPVLGYP